MTTALDKAVGRIASYEAGDDLWTIYGDTFEANLSRHYADLRLILNALREQGESLERLASSEAFDMPQAIDGPLAEELRQRLDYARAALTRSEAQ